MDNPKVSLETAFYMYNVTTAAEKAEVETIAARDGNTGDVSMEDLEGDESDAAVAIRNHINAQQNNEYHLKGHDYQWGDYRAENPRMVLEVPKAYATRQLEKVREGDSHWYSSDYEAHMAAGRLLRWMFEDRNNSKLADRIENDECVRLLLNIDPRIVREQFCTLLSLDFKDTKQNLSSARYGNLLDHMAQAKGDPSECKTLLSEHFSTEEVVLK